MNTDEMRRMATEAQALIDERSKMTLMERAIVGDVAVDAAIVALVPALAAALADAAGEIDRLNKELDWKSTSLDMGVEIANGLQAERDALREANKKAEAALLNMYLDRSEIERLIASAY